MKNKICSFKPEVNINSKIIAEEAARHYFEGDQAHKTR
jgi:hypothetical protein